jgi:hypothetical protein
MTVARSEVEPGTEVGVRTAAGPVATEGMTRSRLEPDGEAATSLDVEVAIGVKDVGDTGVGVVAGICVIDIGGAGARAVAGFCVIDICDAGAGAVANVGTKDVGDAGAVTGAGPDIGTDAGTEAGAGRIVEIDAMIWFETGMLTRGPTAGAGADAGAGGRVARDPATNVARSGVEPGADAGTVVLDPPSASGPRTGSMSDTVATIWVALISGCRIAAAGPGSLGKPGSPEFNPTGAAVHGRPFADEIAACAGAG